MTNNSPASLADLNETIKQNHSQLSKLLRQVAEFVLDYPSEVAFGTVVVLSKDAGVHPSTWVRFANAFGFSGFSEMRSCFNKAS